MDDQDQLQDALDTDDAMDAGELDDEERDQLADVAPVAVSDNVVGKWCVYDNDLLRFVSSHVHDDQDQAQAELDKLRPETGHDLVVVEV